MSRFIGARKGMLGRTGISSLQGIKAAIVAGVADVNVLFVGDSTGDATAEWIYRIGSALAALYPTHTVNYRLYNNGTDTYDAAVEIAAGSGLRTITIWNASISGAALGTLKGAKFAPAIGDLTDLNGIVISYGHNDTAYNATPYIQHGQMIGFIEQVMLAKPGVPITVILQNPNRDDSNMDPVIASWRAVKALRPELGLVDVYSEFINRGKASGLYLDNIHPSNNAPGTDGTTLFVNKFMQGFSGSAAAPAAGSFIAWLTNRAASDILINGDFAAFAGAVPDSFTLQGAGATLTKDAGVFAPGKSYSVKLVNGTAASHLRQTFSPAQLAIVQSQKVTLAVHHYVSSAGSPGNSTGAIRLLPDPPLTDLTLDPKLIGLDGWRWDVISGLSVAAVLTAFWAMQYASGSGGVTLGTVYIDEMRVFVGEKCGF